MPSADVLSSYPYIVVRIACRRCTRKGSYRLARLAAKCGAEIPMMDLLAHLAGDCAIWDTRHPGAPALCAPTSSTSTFLPHPQTGPQKACGASASSKKPAPNGAPPGKRASASSRTSNGRIRYGKSPSYRVLVGAFPQCRRLSSVTETNTRIELRLNIFSI